MENNMPYLKKVVLSCVSLVCFNSSHADTSIASAIAASMTTQTVNTGSMVYMKNHNMNPQYVSTPYGGYVVPGSSATAKAPTATPAGLSAQPKTPYNTQNQQQNKTQFINGNVAQAFPMAQPTVTAQPAMAGQQSVTQPAAVALQPVTMVQPAMGVQSAAPSQRAAIQPATNQPVATTAAQSPMMLTQQAQ